MKEGNHSPSFWLIVHFARSRRFPGCLRCPHHLLRSLRIRPVPQHWSRSGICGSGPVIFLSGQGSSARRGIGALSAPPGVDEMAPVRRCRSAKALIPKTASTRVSGLGLGWRLRRCGFGAPGVPGFRLAPERRLPLRRQGMWWGWGGWLTSVGARANPPVGAGRGGRSSFRRRSLRRGPGR